jgi:hypothetical protein
MTNFLRWFLVVILSMTALGVLIAGMWHLTAVVWTSADYLLASTGIGAAVGFLRSLDLSGPKKPPTIPPPPLPVIDAA